ncbi:MAG: laccase domain-containing protein [Deltaproteobacteria bacterium]|nr:MAG: laccase domain-containing protein [Deltaproteobacteria bacterium]
MMESRGWLLRSELLSSVSEVVHAFTAKGSGPGPDVDLRDRPHDPGGSYEAWTRVLAAMGGHPDQLAQVRQVHGRRVVEITEPTGPLAVAGEADAMITRRPGIWLAVRTADCVPVLLWAPGAVAAVHAGWRGVASRVVVDAARTLAELAGCRTSDVLAAIGPHASVEHYETGPEVIEALVAAGLDAERVRRGGASGREHADLEQAVRDQLAEVGVVRVDRVPGCTLADERFFSHRRSGGAPGRQASIIALRGS